MSSPDVQASIDYRLPHEAHAWSQGALMGRPWRAGMFEAIGNALRRDAGGQPVRVLELGSGPGFLAAHLLGVMPNLQYVALDFSAAMHQLARERLGLAVRQVRFVERDLRDPDWHHGMPLFDHVITNQTVHELRHRRHATKLHRQVRDLLGPNGSYLVSDHFLGAGGMSDAELYMTPNEQQDALCAAGFAVVERQRQVGDLVLHRAATGLGAQASASSFSISWCSAAKSGSPT